MTLLQTTQANYPPGPPPVGKNPLIQLRFGLYVTKNPLGGNDELVPNLRGHGASSIWGY